MENISRTVSQSLFCFFNCSGESLNQHLMFAFQIQAMNVFNIQSLTVISFYRCTENTLFGRLQFRFHWLLQSLSADRSI